MTAPIDPARPNVARVYDALLGGKDNYPADRELAGRLCDPAAGGYEGLPRLVRANRKFIERAVRWAAARQGIRQFIDLGCGLPARPSVHETARAAAPLARVVYVDNDPVVLCHVRAMQAKGAGLAAADADLGDPAAVLADPELAAVIDLAEPACVILAAVLHFTTSAEAARIVAGYAGRLAPGSLAVVSSVRYADPELSARMRGLYTAGTLADHSPADVEGWLAGLELVPPGVTTAKRWRPGWGESLPPDAPAYVLAAVARKP